MSDRDPSPEVLKKTAKASTAPRRAVGAREVPSPQASILPFITTEFVALKDSLTVAEALAEIRANPPEQQILYFYLLDSSGKLSGVVPTRRLLTAPLDSFVRDIAVSKVIALPHTSTIEDACDFFVLYRLLAFPVVDENRKPLGVITVNLLTDEILDFDEHPDRDAIFETIGLRGRALSTTSPLQAFRFRFPWLSATLASGILCAVLVGMYEQTLAASLILAFFLTLVLGLGESVCVQSLSVTIQALHKKQLRLSEYLHRLRTEIIVSLLLGTCAGTVVAGFILLWKSQWIAAAVIGLSICFSIVGACVIGLSVPTLLHRFRLDPKVASGPIALALTDVATILIYFSVASMVFGHISGN